MPTDAIIRLPATCICGSDLWPCWGVEAVNGPRPMGHEYAGVVEEVGSAVTTIRPGRYGTVRVVPRPGAIERLAGAVPTPHGLVQVQVEGGQVRVDSPIPVRFVSPTGDESSAPAGRSHSVTGRAGDDTRPAHPDIGVPWVEVMEVTGVNS